MERKIRTKRYNLMLPMGLFEQIDAMADSEDASALETLKRCIRIGLIITTLCKAPDTKLIIREGDRERELILL